MRAHDQRLWHKQVAINRCKAGCFSYGESPRTPPLEGTSLHRRNNSVERPWGILSLFTTRLRLGVKSLCHRLRHWQTSGLHLRKAGRFSYDESPRTPPLEGTSLHRRKISVERPWGILSLFTTCLRLRMNDYRNPPATVCDTYWGIEKKGAPPPPTTNTKKCKSTNNHSCVQEGLRKTLPGSTYNEK